MIYFDNSATTKMDEDVIKSYNEINEEFFANPSSMHKFGYIVEEKVKNATHNIASLLNAEASEIIWTSGATESNNFAIREICETYKRSGGHIITTEIEHSSVSNVFKYLETQGFTVTYLKVDSRGQVDLKQLEESIRDDTILVSIMFVNNEIGAVEDLKTIGEIIKNKNKKTFFHTDAVQGFAKYKIDVKKCNVDLLSISSHKFNGPKGAGLLYKNKNLRITPLIYGGGQQLGLRSGTLNVGGIIGTSIAAKKIYDDFDDIVDRLINIRNHMIDRLSELNKEYGNIKINTEKNELFAPHIVSASFSGIRAEVMLHALEEYEIYVSSGSACSTHDKKKSGTLSAINLPNNFLESTIRFSFGKYNTIDEVDIAIDKLKIIIPKYRIK